MAADRCSLLSEPQGLDALLPDGWIHMTFEDGASPVSPSGDSPVTAKSFAMLLALDYRPQNVLLLVHPDLLLPMNDGRPPPAVKSIETILSILDEAGIQADLAEHSPDFPVGQWVRFTDDYAFGANSHEVVVKNMLGKVEADPHGICTPGVSVMVVPVGRTFTYGFPCFILEPVDRPEPSEIERANLLADRTWEDLQERQCWIGLVMPGLTAGKALTEMKGNLALLNRDPEPKSRRGLLRRLAKVLGGFRFSPKGESALLLAERCRSESELSRPLDPLVADIEQWIDGW